jgi:hypothetical protein
MWKGHFSGRERPDRAAWVSGTIPILFSALR